MQGYRINKHNGLLVFKLSGEVTLRQIGELLQQASEDPDFSPALNVLSDSRGMTSSFSYEELLDFARNMPDLRSDVDGVKSANLVAKDLGFGMGRVWQAISENLNMSSESRVFRNLEDTKQWLGLPTDAEIEFP